MSDQTERVVSTDEIELPGREAESLNKSLKAGDCIQFRYASRLQCGRHSAATLEIPAGAIATVLVMHGPDQWGARKGDILFENGFIGKHFSLWGGYDILSPLEAIATTGI